MKKRSIKLIILAVITIFITILSLGQNLIYAASGTLTTRLSYFRYVKNSSGTYEAKGGYSLNTGTSKPVFQIVSANGDTIVGTNYYCLNAEVGDTWNNAVVGTDVTYDTYYDLVKDKDTIAGLSSTYSDIVNSEYYTQILWILDNLYTGSDTEEEISEYISKAGIVFGETGSIVVDGQRQPIETYYYDETVNPDSEFSNTDSDLYKNLYGNPFGIGDGGGYYYIDENNNIGSILISQELIEIAQQAAIWYFTNYLPETNEIYDVYTTSDEVAAKAWLRYTEDLTETNSTQWELLANKTTTIAGEEVKSGAMLQEQAAILYNYLIDKANEASENGYESESAGTIDLSYTNQEEHITEEDDSYLIGPMEITTTGTVTGLDVQVSAGDENITDRVEFVNSDGEQISISENTEFYVRVPKDIEGTIRVTASGEYSVITKKLWIKSTGIEQPIVEVVPETGDTEDTITETFEDKQFDLALRKKIAEISDARGNLVALLNEDGLDATRNVTVNPDTIPDTAEYYHRKDPVVVENGYIVTYEITIYNEGDVEGYASQITDQLPTGLESNFETGYTVTSEKGNRYNVTYDSETNQIILTLDTTSNVTALESFNGTEVDSDTILVECVVTADANSDGETKQYLTNIAYISEACDSEGNIVDADRDGNESTPANHPEYNSDDLNNSEIDAYKGDDSNQSIVNDTNNEYYYRGQEDDDDFETIVLLPKEFDLKLLKYIEEVDGEPSGREITVDTTNLNQTVNGTKVTTADYNVSKAPISVSTGDYIKYTFRIYNEGEIDGYAEEISEEIPEGLEFVWDAGISVNPDGTLNFDNVTSELTTEDRQAIEFNANMLWEIESYDSNDRVSVISTRYLSRDTLADNIIPAFDESQDNGNGEGLSYKEVSVMLKVTTTDTTTIIRNEAAITDDADGDGDDVIDRDSTPEDWNKEDSDDYYDDDENYPKYEEDDEDYDNIKVAVYDLSLRKFISSVSKDGDFSNTETTIEYNRVPEVDTTQLKAGTETTAIYNHSKNPVSASVGDFVLYTIRVYNEGDIAGYASEIVDYLPEYLDFVTSTDEYINSINSVWEYDSETRKVTTRALENTLLEAFDRENDDNNGSGLSYADVQIICKINENALSDGYITNIAEITEYQDEDGDIRDEDIDSTPDDLEYPDNPSDYKDEEINNGDSYIPGQEDDDDFEKLIIRRPGNYDLILVKQDENGEDLNSEATFEVTKGENATETLTVVGRLTIADNVEINDGNVGTADIYTIKETVPPDGYSVFEGTIIVTVNKKMSEDGTTYELDSVEYRVEDENGNDITENTEDANVYLNQDGNIYVEVKDYEIKEFDLALRKFITAVGDEAVDTRIPEVSYENGEIIYTHSKEPVEVVVGDIITYTIRVYNEGEISGFAQEVSDDIPEYLEFLPENETNVEYRWVMYDAEGNVTENVEEAVKVTTDYTSKEYGETLMSNDSSLTENPNLLNAFNPEEEISENNPDYVDVQIAFRVLDPDSNTLIITNRAQISEDADEQGNPVDDNDSTPDEWNDGEDDQDEEHVKVQYFDLALIKYVSKVIVTENGTTTTTETGNDGGEDDIIPKVEIYRKSIDSTIVKFEYTIRITNEGDIAGYASEITDYVPEGLRFYEEDNEGWTDEGNNVISTRLLEDTLLEPGESATVTVVFRWINGEDNLGLKTNIAEISEDDNDKGVPDRDSTPDNQVEGEDDIDDAPVLLQISTGILENTIMYLTGGTIILAVLGLGIFAIKKFVI